MKIRTKLMLALSPLVILLVVLGISGRIQVGSYNKINSTLETNYDQFVLATSIQRDIKNEVISIRNLLINEDEELVQKEITKIEEESKRVSKNIARLGTHAFTEKQLLIMDELDNKYTAFDHYKDQLIGYVLTGNKNAAITLMNDNSETIQKEFEDLISELSTSFETNMYTSLEGERDGFTRNVLIESILSIVITIIITILLFRSIWSFSSRLNRMANVMGGISNGKLDLATEVEVIGKDEFDAVATSFNQMTAALGKEMKVQQDLTWTKSNIAAITTSISGAKTIESLTESFLSQIVPLVGGSHAVFYVVDENEDELDTVFTLRASYAFRERKHMTTSFRTGEGLIGQCAFEKKPITFSNVPSDYITVKSGLGEAPPLNLYLLPILYEGEVKGIIEIASFEPIHDKEQILLEELVNDLGIILESIIGHIKQAKLLEETQMLMEEIQTQSEELQSQQDELKATNEELEQQTITLRDSEQRLQQQQEELEETNTELEEKTNRLEKQNKLFEEKNQQLEIASIELEEKARQLALSSKYKSEFLANMSHELRTPLNSMLILSNLLADNKDKTLSGKQVEFAKTIHTSGKDLLALINDILDLSKIESGKSDVKASNVSLNELADTIERSFRPVANEKHLGFHIDLHDDLPEFIYTDDAKLQQILKNLLANAFKFTEKGEVRLEVSSVASEDNHSTIQFTVKDTGIGIAKEKRDLIFEAFQQVDGTISRKYGGTGLGLSISKEIALLLGGKITLESREGTGSTFSFIVGDYKEEMAEKLVIAHQESAITVENVQPLKEPFIKPEPATEKQSIDENSHIIKLLIVDDDLTQRNSIMELLGDMDVIMKAVSTGKEALDELRRNNFDCLILDLGLTDITGFDLLENLKDEDKQLKIFIYTGRDITAAEEHYLNKYADIIIIKDQHSPQRLKEELGLYLMNKRTDSENFIAEDHDKQLHNKELEGKKVLLVDDDIRNIYALSSTLEQYGMDISFAENGIEALRILNDDPNFNLIITDIMMPEMDGYEAMKQIRQLPSYKHHPIIALTAKAMKGDREKSLMAGASDYIMKPVDNDQLLSLIKVWLFRHEGEPELE
ncbi:response regulator [Sporosarcina thermotolerans]|uniref:Circadian input-output histidine kinase CikA n=1 Tax=Sporosarcina thermotolerans TaxID=633404 RepID=A0AAW9ADI4_9BACL|nr:response regulator [Sporosarcina thermotolerans]MDW0117198.1 response regulator [Sporosarcina thermotolerans]WHT47369.1 response regulator [Sporosarcina thermotolerans]